MTFDGHKTDPIEYLFGCVKDNFVFAPLAVHLDEIAKRNIILIKNIRQGHRTHLHGYGFFVGAVEF